MSIRVVLTQYLASLRERDELDALLPELLVAMGHVVHSRAQVGVPQGGVDVLSSFPRGRGKEAFLFIIKFGNIGRESLYSGAQAIEPSIREAVSDYVRTRLPSSLRNVKKRIVVLTSGVLKQAAQSGFASLTEYVAEHPGCSLELWDIDTLAELIELHLLNESLLLKSGRDHLRGAIATLDDSEASTAHFRRFVDSAFALAPSRRKQSAGVLKKRFLRCCAASEMGWNVFRVWAELEGNLRPSVEGCEYLLLKTWAEGVKSGMAADAGFLHRIEHLKLHLWRALVQYFEKVGAQLLDPQLVMSYAREWVFFNRLVLEEAGRLGLLLLLTPQLVELQVQRETIKENLVQLLNAFPGCRLPVLDGQAIDLSLALVAMMSQGDRGNASGLLMDVVNRLILAVESGRNVPVDTDLVEDAIAVQGGQMELSAVFKVSSLVPMLATVAAMIEDEVALTLIREKLCPVIAGVTLERWFPKEEVEQLAANGASRGLSGVSRGLRAISSTCEDEATASVALPPGAATPKDFQCMAQGQEDLLAISARLFRHPLPTWYVELYRLRAPQVVVQAPGS